MSLPPEIASEARARPPGMYREWHLFRSGDRVEIWSLNTFMCSGHVDDRTDDGEILWVIEERTGTRRLFLRSDKVTLFPA